MTKKFWKDNRGQVLYAVVVAVMFLGVLSMIAMGLTLQHYHAALQKQENIEHYYAVDAAAELLRLGIDDIEQIQNQWDVIIEDLGKTGDDINQYRIKSNTVQVTVGIKDKEFKSWEVNYNAAPAE